ncbi:MAG: hypothetical protein QOJ92_1965 [Frankiales bacterium]|nr:hypothetical protein [Frankiales bacterium]
MSELKRDLRDGVLRLTIDREDKRNSLSAEVLRELGAAVRAASTDDETHVVLVSSAGERVFCSGADLAVMGNDATGLEQHEGRGLLRDLVLAMRACSKPVVARVQGLCLAGGFALAGGCDVVLACESAQFGLPEVDRGLWPFMVGALLAKHMSPKHAFDLMVSGERITARQAYEVGFVSRVLPDEGFDEAVDAYVAKLAAAPPVAVRLGKAAWAAVSETPSLPAALEAMQAQLSLITTTKDAVEGITAFFEKREPRWTGR